MPFCSAPGLMERCHHLPDLTSGADGDRAGLKLGAVGKESISLPTTFSSPHPADLSPSKYKALFFVEKHLRQRGQLGCKGLARDGLLLIKLQETAQQLEWSFPSFQGQGALNSFFFTSKGLKGGAHKGQKGPLCTACAGVYPLCCWCEHASAEALQGPFSAHSAA